MQIIPLACIFIIIFTFAMLGAISIDTYISRALYGHPAATCQQVLQ